MIGGRLELTDLRAIAARKLQCQPEFNFSVDCSGVTNINKLTELRFSLSAMAKLDALTNVRKGN